MIRKSTFVLCLGLAICGALLAGDQPMQIEDSLAIKSPGDIRWTPDSQSVLFTVREWLKDDNRYVTHVYRVSTTGGPPVQLTRGDRGESHPRVSPDGAHLAFLANRKKAEPGESSGGGNQIHILPLSGGEAFQLTEEDHPISTFSWAPDSSSLAFVTRDVHADKKEREKRKKDKFDAVVVDRDLSWSHLWVIGLENKEKNRLTEGGFNVQNPVWSPDGASIAYQTNHNPHQQSAWKHIDDDNSSDIYLVPAAGGTSENLTPAPGRAGSPRWSPDGKNLSFTASKTLDLAAKFELMVMDITSRQIRNLSSDNPDPVSSAEWSADGSALLYSQGKSLYTQVYSIPMAGGDATQLTSGLGISGGFDLSPDGDWLAFSSNDPERAADIWVSRIDGGQPTRLTTLNPELDDLAVARSEAIRWKAPDGWEIEGVLTYPIDYREGQRYPLILNIHGGPTGRFVHSFNSRDTQVWAGRGFAVLQPNPRGSTGYGHSFAQANQGDWGGKDFHYDDMSGVDYVIEMGVADPDKLVVMGGSYGGFSTFWAITQTDRFKAAVAHAAISDWYSFYGQTDIPQYLKWGFEGHAWETTETYRRLSPITFAHKVTTPLLITHGERDFRVHIAQADQYYTALKKMGVEVEFVRYPREGHGIREPNHRLDWVKRHQDWFDKHLGIERHSSAEAEVEPQR